MSSACFGLLEFLTQKSEVNFCALLMASKSFQQILTFLVMMDSVVVVYYLHLCHQTSIASSIKIRMKCYVMFSISIAQSAFFAQSALKSNYDSIVQNTN